ncbi:MAG: hydrophobic protein [Gallionella sp.]|jgi:type IV secretory pathway TrbD component|nr:hydrophobic protein [Gallionella sp.]
MLLLVGLLLVLIIAGAGFALHLLWVIAVILLVLWLVGFAVGRGETAGRHRFYKW